MCRRMVDIQSATAEIRRGKEDRRRSKPQGKNIMSTSATQGDHNNGPYLCGTAVWQYNTAKYNTGPTRGRCCTKCRRLLKQSASLSWTNVAWTADCE